MLTYPLDRNIPNQNAIRFFLFLILVSLLGACSSGGGSLPEEGKQALDEVITEATGPEFSYEIVSASKVKDPEKTGVSMNDRTKIWCVEINQNVEITLSAIIRSLQSSSGASSTGDSTNRFFISEPINGRPWMIDGVNLENDAWQQAGCD